LVLSRVRLMRVRLVLVNFNPINNTYITTSACLCTNICTKRRNLLQGACLELIMKSCFEVNADGESRHG